jgi:hypothetical protein
LFAGILINFFSVLSSRARREDICTWFLKGFDSKARPGGISGGTVLLA